MIINTVVLFLRDLLPIFILLCYLTVFLDNKKLRVVYGTWTLVLGLTWTILFFIIAEIVSEWLDGAGIEIFRVSLIIASYLCLIFIEQLLKQPNSVKVLGILFLGTVSFITLKASSFVIFFNVFSQQSDNLLNIIVGCFVGLGICISFSALFIFFLIELQRSKLRTFVNVLWYLFLAGQLCHTIAFLSQIDFISLGTPVFNLDEYIKDSSEYGHILSTLFGYESSPSKTFIFVYLVAFMLPLLIKFGIKPNIKNSNEKPHHE